MFLVLPERILLLLLFFSNVQGLAIVPGGYGNSSTSATPAFVQSSETPAFVQASSMQTTSTHNKMGGPYYTLSQSYESVPSGTPLEAGPATAYPLTIKPFKASTVGPAEASILQPLPETQASVPAPSITVIPATRSPYKPEPASFPIGFTSQPSPTTIIQSHSNPQPAAPPASSRWPVSMTTHIASPLPPLAPASPIVVISGASIIQGSAPVVIGGTTIAIPGSTPTIVGGETVLLSSGILHVGTATAALLTQAPGAPAATTPLVVGGLTFSAELEPAITGSPVVVGVATVEYIPSASDVVIGTQTLTPGEAITISGTPISLGSELYIGATTGSVPLEIVAIPTGSAAAGLGGVILSVFNGPPGSAPTSLPNATVAMNPFTGAGASVQVERACIFGPLVLSLGIGSLMWLFEVGC